MVALDALALVAAIVACLAGTWAMLVWTPDATDRLRDDAFYEFAWVANVAAGRGPSVSDGVTTSGVQLLWCLLLVPIATLFGAGSLPAVAPAFGLALHALTAVGWSLQVRSRLARACVLLLWFGNPLLLRECQNGQETALACLMASWLWWWRAAAEPRFATVALLAVAARSDLFAVVALLSLWRHRRHWLLALPVPALVLMAHVAANLALGGGVVPDSALPMAWLWRANHELADPTGATTWTTAWWYWRPVLLGGPWALVSAVGLGYCVFVVLRPLWPASWRALPALLVGCAFASGARDLGTAAWAALFLALLPATRRRRMPWALLALLAGLGAIVALHWGVRWYPRDYYVAPLAVAAFAALVRHARSRLLLVVFAAAQLADLGRVRPEPLAGQLEMAMAGSFLSLVLPAGERVGCFNSGLVTFLGDVAAEPADRRGVVNLDGVVDARAFAALREARLGAWLDEQHVRFVLDNPVQFASDPRVPHACGPWFGGGFDAARDLVEVARFDVPGVDNGRPGGDSMRLYWRAGRGAQPDPERFGATRELTGGPDDARYVLWRARAGERLELEAGDGARAVLATVDADTVAFVRIALPRAVPARLFVAGRDAPILQLAPL